MRIVRWGAAAGAVVLVSLPIAAQASILPSPQVDTSSVVSRVSGITSSVLHPTISNLRTGVSHAVPTSSTHTGGLSTVKGITSKGLTAKGLSGAATRHSSVRNAHVRSSSVHNSSLTRASSVHAADTQTVVIPAPTSLATMGLAGLCVACRRRR